MRGHPSASVCSAVFALAAERGGDVAAALHAGYDVASALGPKQPADGRHVTGTLGTLAAAAACARLLELGDDGVERALGLAATQAAGLAASVGTAGKPLHAGKAAADGMLAALLSEQGCTAPPVEPFTVTEPGVRSIVFKRHACCGLAQETIDALLAVPADHVRSVVLEVAPAVARLCRHAQPRDAAEARFSLHHCAALALARRDTGPAGFEAVDDPELTALRSLVTVVEADRPDTRAMVELADGRRVEATSAPDAPATDDELPAQWMRLEAKFRAAVDHPCATAIVEHVSAGRLLEAVYAAGMPRASASSVPS
jgi:2-methylcitrate dehydratase PrpD